MFDMATYRHRRDRLRSALDSGLVLFPGNDHSPSNFAANPYPFRQDASFLYFFGLDVPRLAAAIDLDDGTESIYGDDATVDDTVWTGPRPTLAEQASQAGVTDTRPFARFFEDAKRAIDGGRPVHVLPQYRGDNMLALEQATGWPAARMNEYASPALRDAVIALRSVKSDEEIAEIERALEVTARMHRLAMGATAPGVIEREVVATLGALVEAEGSHFAYAPILTRRGEVLHNESRSGLFADGDLVLCDAGAASPLGYAADVTRTWPANGRFTAVQRDLYGIVLGAQREAIDAIRPGIPFRDVHLLAARRLAHGLRDLGLMRGDVDEAVAAGAHALFFPHGVGHMMGLDVHDMEALGEDHVGYDAETRRSDQFGLGNLRLARRLEPGFVVTVEPGLYFIPGLIDRWRAERRHEAFIDYDAVARYRDFGGIRIEDDVLVTATGGRVLGSDIPRAAEEVEAAAAAADEARLHGALPDGR